MSIKVTLNHVKTRLMFLSPSVQLGKEPEYSTKDFKVLAGLGVGSMGKVYKVKYRVSNEYYAIKQILKKDLVKNKMLSKLATEIKIQYILNHENIIKLYNHFEEEDFIYLILEYAEGGQLWQRLNQVRRYDENTVKKYLKDIVSAIEYLHSHNPPIIHRDIKPENILFDSNDVIKLADFGWSTYFNDSKRITVSGTKEYMAPEIMLGSGHDCSVDIWALGVLTFELLTGQLPFLPQSVHSTNEKTQIQIMNENIINANIDFPEDFPTEAKALVTLLLSKNPQKRPSINELKNHYWLQDVSFKPAQVLDLRVKQNDISMFTNEEAENILEKKKKSPENNNEQLKKQMIKSQFDKLEDTGNAEENFQKSVNDFKQKILMAREKKSQLLKEYEALKEINNQRKNHSESLATHELRKLREETAKIGIEFNALEEEISKKSESNHIAVSEDEYEQKISLKKDLEEELEQKNLILEKALEEKEEVLIENRKKIKAEFRNNNILSLSNEQIEKISVNLKKIKDSLQSYFGNNNRLSKLSDTYVDLLKKIFLEKLNLDNIRTEKNSHIIEKFEDDVEQSKREFRERMRKMKEKFEEDNAEVEKAVKELKQSNLRNWKKSNELQNLKKVNFLITSIINDAKMETELVVQIIADYKERIFEMSSKIKDMEYVLKK